MEKLGNFLWKIFSMTMVFVCHIGSDSAVAAPADDPKISEFFVSSDDVSRPTTIRLCPSGEYLSRCGNAVLGNYWLKGMTKTKNGAQIQTPNYLSDATDDVNTENLRKFFAHNETLTYTNSDSEIATVDPNTYKYYLYQILSNFCTDTEGKTSVHVCEKCPNNALVSASTVKEDSYDSGKILWDTWNVHTIADCYMNEFSDDTGTYVYVNNAVALENDTAGNNCYYSKTTNGSTLFYK